MILPAAVLHLLDKLEGWAHNLFLLLPNIVLAIITVFVFWGLARLLDRGLRRLMRRFRIGDELIDLTAVFAFIVIVGIGIFIALDALGFDKTIASLLAGVGILALAVGLALRSTGENWVAGIYIAVAHPFRVGQTIGSNDFFGVVERITLRATLLRVPEGQLVHLPNKAVFEKAIVNYSDSGLRRVDIEVRAGFDADLEQVQRIAIEAVSAMETRIASRPVELFYDEFDDSWISFQIRFWIPFERQIQYRAARSEAIMLLKRAFDENDIAIPVPIRKLDYLRGTGNAVLEE